MQVYVAQTDFLKEEITFRRYYELVSLIRSAKVDSMRAGQDKELSLLAGLVLREGLIRSGICYERIRIAYGPYGKPYLDGADKQIYFNLSHSGNMVMGIFDDVEVGCDVEKTGHRGDNIKIAKRFFHTEEFEALVGLKDEGAREDLFYRIWTLKESFMKACGLGMKLDMRTFSVMEFIGTGNPVINPATQESYALKEYAVLEGFHFACCGRQHAFPREPETLVFV